MNTGLRTEAASPQRRQRQRQLQLWFYLGVPLLIGFFLGWIQVGRTAEWPRYVSLLYWMGVSFGSLFLLELLTPPFASVLRPRGVPLWITLIIAQVVIGWLAILPVMRFFTEFVQSFLPIALAHPLQDGSLATVLQKLPTNIMTWVGINLLFFYGLGMERFGYQPPARHFPALPEGTDSDSDPDPAGFAPAPTAPDFDVGEPDVPATDSPRPVFMTRMRDARLGQLLALQADGHYLHVHTDAGCDMILYRFSDALTELPDSEGMRVHRSWWVAERAVDSKEKGEKLTLVNGVTVPVSRSYRVRVRERGWLS